MAFSTAPRSTGRKASRLCREAHRTVRAEKLQSLGLEGASCGLAWRARHREAQDEARQAELATQGLMSLCQESSIYSKGSGSPQWLSRRPPSFPGMKLTML